ncbi:hypothetical protein ACWD5R_36060 [Streptomyces sp. NPDC002514]|uniref:hypothetical protein n=1 Tax=unclassified Streptomyces TaxID=2593676 RepID=UPI0036856FE8
MTVPMRRLVVALVVCCALLAGATACGSSSTTSRETPAAAVHLAATPSPSTSAQRQKFAKTRFVLNAGLAAGATYKWIVKPAREGKFKKGAKHRRTALVKAALAGAFSYNRLKAAVRNAQGDPALARALAPLERGIEGLKNLPASLRRGGNSGNQAADSFNSVINQVKDAGRSQGAVVHNQVPTTAQLTSGARS